MSPSNDPDLCLDLADAATYDHWTPVTIRFSDQDSLGHINNVSYAAYVEVGRIAWGMGLVERVGAKNIDFILANVSIDYLRESHYPGTIQVGTRATRIGTKSVTLGFGLFLNDIAVASARSTIVFIDEKSRATVPVPEGVRALIEEELAG
jgi:acyl-CoA thioester hydrolase